jgi:hypothetical protein
MAIILPLNQNQFTAEHAETAEIICPKPFLTFVFKEFIASYNFIFLFTRGLEPLAIFTPVSTSTSVVKFFIFLFFFLQFIITRDIRQELV